MKINALHGLSALLRTRRSFPNPNFEKNVHSRRLTLLNRRIQRNRERKLALENIANDDNSHAYDYIRANFVVGLNWNPRIYIKDGKPLFKEYSKNFFGQSYSFFGTNKPFLIIPKNANYVYF